MSMKAPGIFYFVLMAYDHRFVGAHRTKEAAKMNCPGDGEVWEADTKRERIRPVMFRTLAGRWIPLNSAKG